MSATARGGNGTAPLVSVRNLKKEFPIKKGVFSRQVGAVKTVNDVSFHVARGETLGVVGESGCGKTTTGRTILRLLEPTSGEIYFEDRDVRALGTRDLRALRRDMQIIFQDPVSSLNPRMTVGAIVREGLTIHKLAEGAAADARVSQLLQEVGLRREYATRYPHEFSGGQRQRIGIARHQVVGIDDRQRIRRHAAREALAVLGEKARIDRQMPHARFPQISLPTRASSSAQARGP